MGKIQTANYYLFSEVSEVDGCLDSFLSVEKPLKFDGDKWQLEHPNLTSNVSRVFVNSAPPIAGKCMRVECTFHPCDETFYDRLIHEKEELSDKVNKLKMFINSEKFKPLSERMQNLMRMQYNAMTIYCDCLVKRQNLICNEA